MGQAAKEANPPKERVFAEVTSFQQKYAEALEDAQLSAAHTATDGWQDLYGRHRKDVEERRKEIAGQLRDVATCIERGIIDEDTEKAIQDAKKRIVAVAVDSSVFEARTVKPVKEAVYRCHETIEQARRDARVAEANAPLQARGLLEAMDNAIAAFPKVKFADDTGRVEIE